MLKFKTLSKFYLFGLQRSHIVETEPFADTFGPKAQRKRPRVDVGSFEELGKVGAAAAEEAEEKADAAAIAPEGM